jgi:hypothetical protein
MDRIFPLTFDLRRYIGFATSIESIKSAANRLFLINLGPRTANVLIGEPLEERLLDNKWVSAVAQPLDVFDGDKASVRQA